MQNYKDLKVWQKAHALTLIVYKITRCFPKEETFGITSQMRRASVSIPANIAEGCGRMTRPDIANFFQIALGSLHELEYYALLAHDLHYVDAIRFREMDALLRETKAMLVSLIKKIRSC